MQLVRTHSLICRIAPYLPKISYISSGEISNGRFLQVHRISGTIMTSSPSKVGMRPPKYWPTRTTHFSLRQKVHDIEIIQHSNALYGTFWGSSLLPHVPPLFPFFLPSRLWHITRDKMDQTFLLHLVYCRQLKTGQWKGLGTRQQEPSTLYME